MKIGFNMRQALKKHPPMGMLEGIEEKITETFLTNPNSEFVAEEMSSFERLLLHALCAYNALNSYSKKRNHEMSNLILFLQALISAGRELSGLKTRTQNFSARTPACASTWP